jgi:hypothetical protein
MVAERPLDLGGVDVLPTGDEHVLLAVDDVEEAVGVPPGQVAGVKPAPRVDRRGAGGRVLEVTGEHRRALEDQLAHLAGRDLPAVLADHGGAHEPVRPADRAGLGHGVLQPHAERARTELGQAEALLEGDLVHRPPALDHADRQRRAAAGHEAQAGQVGAAEPRRGEQQLVLRGDAEEHGDALALDQVEHGVRVPRPHQHHGAAEDQQRQGVDQQPAGVEHRRVGDGDVATVQLVHGGVERVPGDHPVAHHGRLGGPGGSRR